MFKPARFRKFAKVTIITLEYVSSKTNTQTECLVGLLQGLPCSIGEVPVSSNEVESVSKVVYVQIKISQTAILFGELTHLLSHLPVASHTAHRIMKESMHSLVKLFGI